MRNAFVRMLNERMAKDHSLGSDEQKAQIKEAIEELGRAFPKSQLAVGHDLSFYREADRITVLYQGEQQATVQSQWLAENMVKAYLDNNEDTNATSSGAAVLIPSLVEDILRNNC
jgi:ABC-type glutathione transport system ATPase component